MIRAPLLGALLAAMLAAWVPGTVVAQGQSGQSSPVLTLDQDRLYLNSLFGQRVQRELAAASADLSRENRRIEAALVEEEQGLTQDRAGMEPDAFRALATEFDERVTAIRTAQDRKASAIQREADSERARFFEMAFPVLLRLVEETGAVAILDTSAVVFSVRQIDITEAAIARVDQIIGADQRPRGDAPQPAQRPDAPEQAPEDTPDDTPEDPTGADPATTSQD